MLHVIVSSAPVHFEPDHASGRETDALFGEAVEVLRTSEEWSEIILATDGYQGWIETTALGPAPLPDHYVLTPRCLITTSPDIKSPAAGWLPMMAQVKASASGKGIMAVHAAAAGEDEIIGHVPAHHLRPLGHVVADWVAVAESLIGTPYRWGGRDGIGIDCSALVQLSLAAGGIRAMRNSGDQEKTLGRTIDPSLGLVRGDLVFWKGHIGIMTDPDTLLHANMHHAMTATEPLAEALIRLENLGLPATRFARV